ncbi:MAG: UDP-N-acetylmuramoyl-tripeptide--D-alanyl-D-alanine ligase [Deltaproteobacteria bacterium]|nr:UDP-N-acetylmuramoyl-tripeptide--D-alanyl-D-alanine ligase [Deltaproteobacteria bacterium]
MSGPTTPAAVRPPSPWRIDDVVRASRGRVVRCGSAERFGRITTDTRTLAAGDLFVALAGERHDAHDFAAAAAAAGARGLVVARPVTLPSEADVVVVEVDDTLRALQALAADLRRRVAPRVLALTGSNGKTTTKEMLAAILEEVAPGRVLKTQGNLNNLIGVPLTLLGLAGDEAYAVVEMGMNAYGEIRRLTEIADPDVGLITNVGPAHLEGLGSVEGVARAKGELFATMRRDATIVVNAEDPHVRAQAAAFPGRQVAFGAGTDVTAEAITCDARGAAAFRLRIAGGAVDVRLRVPGRHNVMNALAAAAAAWVVGAAPAAIAAGLAAAEPVGGRMRVVALASGVTVVDDSYNANPASVAAALRSLADAPAIRRIAVLGDMLELGSASPAQHRAVGALAGTVGLAALYLHGDFARETAAGAATGMAAAAIHVAASHAAIADALAADARRGDWVLVKGSRGQRMEEVVRLLGAH